MSGSIQQTERCHATTKRRGANTRCKHRTTRSTMCWQHLQALKQLRIKTSPIKNAKLGLFTTDDIDKGSIIAKYTGDVVIDKDPDFHSPYALQIAPTKYIDASRSNTAEGRYANDALNNQAYDNNAELLYNKRGRYGYLKATRDIWKGEEILTSYGDDYWSKDIDRKKGSRVPTEHAHREIADLDDATRDDDQGIEPLQSDERKENPGFPKEEVIPAKPAKKKSRLIKPKKPRMSNEEVDFQYKKVYEELGERPPIVADEGLRHWVLKRRGLKEGQKRLAESKLAPISNIRIKKALINYQPFPEVAMPPLVIPQVMRKIPKKVVPVRNAGPPRPAATAIIPRRV